MGCCQMCDRGRDFNRNERPKHLVWRGRGPSFHKARGCSTGSATEQCVKAVKKSQWNWGWEAGSFNDGHPHRWRGKGQIWQKGASTKDAQKTGRVSFGGSKKRTTKPANSVSNRGEKIFLRPRILLGGRFGGGFQTNPTSKGNRPIVCLTVSREQSGKNHNLGGWES